MKYFGTDGVRGKVGEKLTSSMAYRIGRFIGQYPNGKSNKIVVSRDTRISGDMLFMYLSKGIKDSGGIVYDEGVSSTPSISFLVNKHDYDYGIMISASHNPFEDNGIKIFNKIGEKLEAEIENLIEEYMDSKEDYLPKKEGLVYFDEKLKKEYIENLLSKVDCDLSQLKVAVDCANGSASKIVPELFAKLGIKADFLAIDPDGTNINLNCGSTHLENLVDKVKSGNYDLGFAFDGDADRFLAINHDGRIIDGDGIIYLNALSMRNKGTLKQDTVVITVMSNFGLRKKLEEDGIKYNIVSVGDKYVQAELKKNNLSLGGEQSGHVIFMDELNTGDGILSCLKLTMIYVKEKEIFNKIDSLVIYPQILENIRLETGVIPGEILDKSAVKAAIKECELKLGDSGRLLVRPSGTEPLIRVMVESLDQEVCKSVIDLMVKTIKEAL